MPIDITNANHEQEILKSSKPVVVDVYASWCGPCQLMAPIVDQLEKEMGARYKFAKINVDEARDLSIKYGVISIPTFLFIKDGQVKEKSTGYISKDALKEKIEKTLA